MYLLGHAADLQAKKNSFDFMLSTGSCFDYKLKKDIAEFGNKAFNFKVLETLEKKNEQSREDFEDDLNVLHQIWKDSWILRRDISLIQTRPCHLILIFIENKWRQWYQ
jgi:hypothetical protein